MVPLCGFSPVIIYSLTTSGKPIDQFSEASNLNHPTGLKRQQDVRDMLY